MARKRGHLNGKTDVVQRKSNQIATNNEEDGGAFKGCIELMTIVPFASFSRAARKRISASRRWARRRAYTGSLHRTIIETNLPSLDIEGLPAENVRANTITNGSRALNDAVSFLSAPTATGNCVTWVEIDWNRSIVPEKGAHYENGQLDDYRNRKTQRE